MSWNLPANFLNGRAAASHQTLLITDTQCDRTPYGERFTMATRPGGSNSNLHQNVKECQIEGREKTTRGGEGRGEEIQ